MEKSCIEFLSRVDALLDGELPPEATGAVEAHLETCPACRSERQARGTLKRALSRTALPPPSRRFDPALLKAPSPLAAAWTRVRPAWRWSAAAAAVLIVLLVFLLSPAGLPDVVALSVKLHEGYLSGALTPRDLGLKIALPGADYVGHCDCPPQMGSSSPFVVYRKGQTPISLLVIEADPGSLPARARRSRDGRDYYFFRADRDSAIVCQSGKLCHIWVARLEETDLVTTILATREGRRLLSGERLTLEGIT